MNKIKAFLNSRVKYLQKRYPEHSIGRYTYGSAKVFSRYNGASLSIGSFCSIADGVKILLGDEHRTDWATTYPFNVLWPKARNQTGHPKSKGDVFIGSDVWIGFDAMILSGVRIGDGAVIGARSVVANNVEPYAIYGGNPARLIRFRFADDIISQLLELKWWNLKDSDIEKLLPLMLDTNIQAFIDATRRLKKIDSNDI